MLKQNQINYLTKLCDIKTIIYKENVIGLRPTKSRHIKILYEEFKNAMGLDDLDYHYITSYGAYIAGGAVLNWILGEDHNNDVDFFFTNAGAYERFQNLISGLGFECEDYPLIKFKKYSYKDRKNIQVVGGNSVYEIDDYKEISINPYKFPPDNIDRFDFRLCQLAVDCDNVYLTTGAVQDLITRNISSIKRAVFETRVKRYLAKGFYYSRQSKNYTPKRWPHYLLKTNINKLKLQIIGAIKDMDCSLVLIDKPWYMVGDLINTYGIPVRQYKLNYGEYTANKNEFILPNYLLKR